MSNRLTLSSSPYLQQHQHNPVDWFSWSEEALLKAKREAKPIFLSIGYSSCHWCHVMERESFSRPEIAEILNREFISIKVDREERPDLDHVYMTAVQMMTGEGGWPLNVFLTSDLKPFFGGTYFPLEARYGKPAFRELLLRLAEVYKTQQDLVRKNANELTALLIQSSQIFSQGRSAHEKVGDLILENLKKNYEPEYGGLGQAPKFFHVDGLRFLLRRGVEQKDDSLLQMVEHSLMKMAGGGIYDQIAGGFHRYSTDSAWLTPHFEKMLYDNALLAPLYVEAWQVTKNPFYRRIAREILNWALREMEDPLGGFHSAIDADSEHKEGLFYTWTFDELQSQLSDEDFREFRERFSVTAEGNFEGRNILYPKTPLTNEERVRWNSIFERFLRIRNKRQWPLIDRKVLTSWNGLMISALSQVGCILQEDSYLFAAERACKRIWSQGYDARSLRHSFFGEKTNPATFLEDYAYFGEGLLDLFAATQNATYFFKAEELGRCLLRDFYDPESQGFWSTKAGEQDLLLRYKEAYDGALPSPTSRALSLLERLYSLTGSQEFRTPYDNTVKLLLPAATESPGGFHSFAFIAEDFFKGSTFVIAVSPSHEDEETLLNTYGVRSRSFLWKRPSEEIQKIPAFQGKTWSERPRVYTCREGSCSLSEAGLG